MIKLIIFDLWQTLAYRDTKSSSTSEIIEKTKLNIPRDKFIKIFENSVQTKEWDSEYAMYENLCKNMNLPTTKENVNILMDIRITAEKKTKLFPHTINMLTQLRNEGFKIGLISNTSNFSVKRLKESTNLLDYIDYPLFSFNVGVIKPDLKSFKEILGIVGCKPEEAIMIGDKEGDDVLPPRQIGMNSIHYTDYNSLKKEFEKYDIFLD